MYLCTALKIVACITGVMSHGGDAGYERIWSMVYKNCVHYRYQHQFENCTYICKTCHSNGKEVVVTPKFTASSDTSWFGLAKYAWSGYVYVIYIYIYTVIIWVKFWLCITVLTVNHIMILLSLHSFKLWLFQTHSFRILFFSICQICHWVSLLWSDISESSILVW